MPTERNRLVLTTLIQDTFRQRKKQREARKPSEKRSEEEGDDVVYDDDLHQDDAEDSEDSDFETFDGSQSGSIDWDEILLSTLSQVGFDIMEKQLKKHQVLARVLGLMQEDSGDAQLAYIFTTACVLCDKLTKPSNNDTFNISLDLTSKLLVLFAFNFNSPVAEFDLAFKLARIVEAVLVFLKLERPDDAELDAILTEKEKILNNGDEIVHTAKLILFKHASAVETLRGSVDENMSMSQMLDAVYARKYADAAVQQQQQPLSKNRTPGKRLDPVDEVLDRFTADIAKLPIYQAAFYRDWLPLNVSHMDLELLYSILAVSVYTICKLNARLSGDPQYYCAFMRFFVRLWKQLTRLMVLGIQIDRLDEEIYGLGTPWVVRSVLKGCAAIRSVLAAIINGDMPQHRHDLEHESLNNFMAPFGRKTGEGVVHTEVTEYVAALVVLGHDMNELGQLFIGDDLDDRYDEDIWYMFEYEFTTDDEAEEEDPGAKHQKVYIKKEYTARCYCEFDDQDTDEDAGDIGDIGGGGGGGQGDIGDIGGKDDDDENDENEDEEVPGRTAALENVPFKLGMRAKDGGVEFDSLGRDWRDIPRGSNIYFNTARDLGDFGVQYVELQGMEDVVESDDDDEDEEGRVELYTSWKELHLMFMTMAKESVPEAVQRNVVATVAFSVGAEYEEEVERTAAEICKRCSSQSSGKPRANNCKRRASAEAKEPPKGTDDINPDKIYELWSYQWLFEPMLRLNPSAACSMMDEMLMAKGYRRALIWLLTHLELSHTLLNYVHELSTNKRGTAQSSLRYPLSRDGFLALSEIERSMLLHELFSNASVYLSAVSEDLDTADPAVDASTGTERGFRYLKDFQSAKKIMEIICLMMRSLAEKKIISLASDDYRAELQSLLIRWIGVLPEARALYFATKQPSVDDNRKEVTNLAKEALFVSKYANDTDSLDEVPLKSNKVGKNTFLRLTVDQLVKEITLENKTPDISQVVKFGNGFARHFPLNSV